MVFQKCHQYLRKFYRKPGLPYNSKRPRSTSVERYSEKDIKHQILQYTHLTRDHMTPELALFLITPKSPLWYTTAENCPFTDPFWAFYWPGGQAMTRYILDNPEVFRGHKVLDLGSGCGASAIACSKVGASEVLANDIDKDAIAAIKLNSKENSTKVRTNYSNLIGVRNPDWTTIILGDMFYDEAFRDILIDWLSKHYRHYKTNIFIGDPGRLPLVDHPFRYDLTKVAVYELSSTCQQENPGFTEGVVWKFEPS